MQLPAIQREPEALEWILIHNMMSQYGSGYTISSLMNEAWQDLLYLQICMHFEGVAMDMKQKKADFYSEEGLQAVV